MAEDNRTVQDVFNTLSEHQKTVIYTMIGTLMWMTDDQMRVTAYLVDQAIAQEAAKRVNRRTS